MSTTTPTEKSRTEQPTEHRVETVPEFDKHGRYTGHDYAACSCGAEAMRQRDLPCGGGE